MVVPDGQEQVLLTASLLDERRRMGLCARCGNTLRARERAKEGGGGSYVRCDRCVREIMAAAAGECDV